MRHQAWSRKEITKAIALDFDSTLPSKPSLILTEQQLTQNSPIHQHGLSHLSFAFTEIPDHQNAHKGSNAAASDSTPSASSSADLHKSVPGGDRLATAPANELLQSVGFTNYDEMRRVLALDIGKRVCESYAHEGDEECKSRSVKTHDEYIPVLLEISRLSKWIGYAVQRLGMKEYIG